MENLFFDENGKKITCGVIIENDNGEFLIGHCTGKKDIEGTYDIPKGCMENGESPLETALREVKEEINIDLSHDNLIDLGLFKYNTEKDLYLFWVKKNLNYSELKCESYFIDRFGRERPEIDKYSLATRNDLSMLYKILQRILPEAFKKLDRIDADN